MKVIDLLNKIANGEEVKAFKYDEYIFKYDKDSKLWKNENGAIFSTYCYVEECLNDKVEILEKKIPEKLDIYNELQSLLKDNNIDEHNLHKMLKKIELKQNEIIDHLKSKGE